MRPIGASPDTLIGASLVTLMGIGLGGTLGERGTTGPGAGLCKFLPVFACCGVRFMKTRKHQRENLSGVRRSKWFRNDFGVPPHFLTWFLYSSPFRNIKPPRDRIELFGVGRPARAGCWSSCEMSRSPRPDGEDAVELLKQKAEADRREKLHRKKELRAMSEMTMRDWTRFSEYDVAGDRQLDWEAFLAMVPERVRKVHSIEQLRAVFSAADVDQDGILSLAEYFRWTMAKALITLGKETVLNTFIYYDKNDRGRLDIKQWDSLAIEMGFGAVSREVFRALDANGTGFINFREIPDSSALDVHVPGDEASDSLLASLVRTWNDSIDLERADILNATGWVIRGRDFETIRAELRALLTASGGHVVDLIKVSGCVLCERHAVIRPARH